MAVTDIIIIKIIFSDHTKTFVENHHFGHKLGIHYFIYYVCACVCVCFKEGKIKCQINPCWTIAIFTRQDSVALQASSVGLCILGMNPYTPWASTYSIIAIQTMEKSNIEEKYAAVFMSGKLVDSLLQTLFKDRLEIWNICCTD